MPRSVYGNVQTSRTFPTIGSIVPAAGVDPALGLNVKSGVGETGGYLHLLARIGSNIQRRRILLRSLNNEIFGGSALGPRYVRRGNEQTRLVARSIEHNINNCVDFDSGRNTGKRKERWCRHDHLSRRSTQTLAYDANGNILSRRTRAGATIAFTYDTLNRLSTKSAPSEASATYAYDLAGRLIGASDTSAAIVAPTPGGMLATMSLSYDALNRPLNLSWTPAAAQTAPPASSASFAYTYNAANQRIAQTATDNSYWSYPAPTASLINYTANSLDQYSAVGAVTPTYDGNGNLTFDGTFTYSYDAESRLISASGAGNSATYAYDALGRRKSKTVNGTTTIFVQDPQGRALIDYNGATGAIGDWYAFGLGPNDALAQMSGAGTTRATYVPDIQGSIVASLDAASGALTKTGYQPYGESATTAGAFRFTGARIDAETNGLCDFRARIYAPPWGRFWQPDSIGYAGGGEPLCICQQRPA